MTTRLRFRTCLLSAIALFCGATTAGVAHADTVDIGTGGTVNFGALDCLTNTGGVTDATISFSEGSDLTGVDFAALGLTSLTLTTADNDSLTTWDGVNFSGLSLTLGGANGTANNQFRSDSFVGTDFSGATINAAGNQPFVTAGGAGLNLTDANFSGATFNLGTLTTLGFAVYAGGGSLADADFTDTVWNYTGAGNAASFSIGPGSTSIADSASAADFSGADFSGVTNLGSTITNLGAFDGTTAIGAFYDANTVLPAGVTTAQLDAAGWQNATVTTAVPEPSSLALLGLGGLGMLMRRRK